MSEPKLNIKEESSAKKTRSPPKKSKVEQSVPRNVRCMPLLPPGLRCIERLTGMRTIMWARRL